MEAVGKTCVFNRKLAESRIRWSRYRANCYKWLMGRGISSFTWHKNHWLWMALKSQYTFCYANRVELWLSDNWWGIGDDGVGQVDPP